MCFQKPYIGLQTVQEYHPERGVNNQMQVSTYGPDGWMIQHCARADVEKAKQEHLDRIKIKDCV